MKNLQIKLNKIHRETKKLDQRKILLTHRLTNILYSTSKKDLSKLVDGEFIIKFIQKNYSKMFNDKNSINNSVNILNIVVKKEIEDLIAKEAVFIYKSHFQS